MQTICHENKSIITLLIKIHYTRYYEGHPAEFREYSRHDFKVNIYLINRRITKALSSDTYVWLLSNVHTSYTYLFSLRVIKRDVPHTSTHGTEKENQYTETEVDELRKHVELLQKENTSLTEEKNELHTRSAVLYHLFCQTLKSLLCLC